jgi:adenosine deaminase CECR1
MIARLLALLCVVGALPGRAEPFADRFAALTAKADPGALYSLLYDLPKGGDLHNHAGGANRAEWAYAVAVDPARNGHDIFYTRARGLTDATAPGERYRNIRQKTYDLLPAGSKKDFIPLSSLSEPEKAEWYSSLRLDLPGEGRQEFFGVIWPRMGQLLTSLPVITELLVENMKAFGAEHLAYLETQFMVTGLVDNDGHAIDPDQAVAFVKARLAQPDAVATGVVVRFQHTVLRFAPDAEQRLEENYAFVERHRDLWVGMNFAGIEENGKGYPLRFLATLRKLRATYPTLPLSIHAGEMDGPDSHIRDSLLLGASRIGHGVNLIQDPETLLRLQQSKQVLVECNLISNQLLEYTPDVDQHPFPEYLRTGVPVCLNTDDRGIWDSNLTDEYYTAVTHFHLSWEEIRLIGHNSIAYSFAQPEVKQALLQAYDERMARFVEVYGAGSVEDALAHLQTVHPVTYSYAKRTWNLAFP